MMYIEGHWESVNDLDDVIKIIREYYNRELADKMENLTEENNVLKERIIELESIIEDVRMSVW